jgi:hypothetical protein
MRPDAGLPPRSGRGRRGRMSPALVGALAGAVLVAACGAPEAGEQAPGAAADMSLGELATTALAENQVTRFGDGLLDDIGARVSALPSGQAAQDWVEEQFRAFGLSNVRQESFDLLAWDRVEAGITVLEFASFRWGTWEVTRWRPSSWMPATAPPRRSRRWEMRSGGGSWWWT